MLNYRSVFAALALCCSASAGATTQTELAAWVKGLPPIPNSKSTTCEGVKGDEQLQQNWVQFQSLFNEKAFIFKDMVTPNDLCFKISTPQTSFDNYLRQLGDNKLLRIVNTTRFSITDDYAGSVQFITQDFRYYFVSASKSGSVLVKNYKAGFISSVGKSSLTEGYLAFLQHYFVDSTLFADSQFKSIGVNKSCYGNTVDLFAELNKVPLNSCKVTKSGRFYKISGLDAFGQEFVFDIKSKKMTIKR